MNIVKEDGTEEDAMYKEGKKLELEVSPEMKATLTFDKKKYLGLY